MNIVDGNQQKGVMVRVEHKGDDGSFVTALAAKTISTTNQNDPYAHDFNTEGNPFSVAENSGESGFGVSGLSFKF